MANGKKLKQHLEDRGLRFKFVAKQVGIPYSTFMHYLNEHKPIPESKLRLVCLTFGISVKNFDLDDYQSSHEREAG